MKYLLIPIFMLAGALSLQAHCGSCGTGEAHAEKSAAKMESSEKKACCAKDKMKESVDKAACCKKSDTKKAECCKKTDAQKAACEQSDKKKAECTKCCDKAECSKDSMKSEKAASSKSESMPAAACCAKPKA